jgi:hypothetical protein
VSSDNWAFCPKCKADRAKAALSAIKKAQDAYGKVSAKEYIELVDEADSIAEGDREPTLREDFDIGVAPDGEFSVVYTCHCKCGFSYTFRHSQNVLNPQEKEKES